MDGRPRREAFLVAESKIKNMYTEKGNESLVQVLAPQNNIKNIAAVATHTKAVSTVTRFELVQRKPVEESSASAVVASTTAVSSSHASGNDAPSNHGRRKAFDVANLKIQSACTKPVGMMPTKATGENELKRKELKLKQLKGKEDEAARKREEAKLKEQKRKHDGRAKHALARHSPAFRAKRALAKIGQQKLEDKGEKSAHLKHRMQAGNQEKAKRQTEVEKAKTGGVADVAVAGPSMVNSTVQLTSSLISIYQISPVHVTDNEKPFNPDNYDIGDLREDDSPDKWDRPKKTIPTWARSCKFIVALEKQADADTDQIFPKKILFTGPILSDMFEIQRERFNQRTSSGDWETSPLN